MLEKNEMIERLENLMDEMHGCDDYLFNYISYDEHHMVIDFSELDLETQICDLDTDLSIFTMETLALIYALASEHQIVIVDYDYNEMMEVATIKDYIIGDNLDYEE